MAPMMPQPGSPQGLSFKGGKLTTLLHLLLLAAAVGGTPGCGADSSKHRAAQETDGLDPAAQKPDGHEPATRESDGHAVDKAKFWGELLVGVEPPSQQRDERVVSEEEGRTIVVERIASHAPNAELRRELEGLALRRGVGKHEARRFVAGVLTASHKHRRVFSSKDSEVAVLEGVGPEHLDVLLEPLEYAKLHGATIHLVHAVKKLAREQHKQMILGSLSSEQGLVGVVESMGWIAEAAPVLLARLNERSPYLDPRWVAAAAKLPGAQHHDDLKFQLARGRSPLRVWEAIRHLPGMDPLDAFVEETWRSTAKEEHFDSWYELAVVAAHYGHVDALEAFAHWLPRKPWWWEMFHALTDYGQPRLDRGQSEDAKAWVAANRNKLVFDRASRRYRLD